MRLLLGLALLAAAAAAHPAYDIAVDEGGNVYLLDWPRAHLLRVSPDGTAKRVADFSKVTGAATPHTLALDGDGNVLVGATYGERIWRVTPRGDVALLESVRTHLAGGAALNLSVGPTGLLHVVVDDRERPPKKHRYRILRIPPEGPAVTLLEVERGDPGFLNLYGGSICAGKDVCYVASDHRIFALEPGKPRRVVAGAPEKGYRDGKGAHARFHAPWGLCLDRDGSLLVADSRNDRVRRVARGGTVTTVAPDARFDGPYAVAIGPGGGIVVAEYVQSASPARNRLRVIQEGTVRTLFSLETR